MDEETKPAAAPEAAGEEKAPSPLEQRTAELIKEGYRKDVAQQRAAELIRLDGLIAEKRAAGLTAEQARAVAEQQILEDRAARKK